MTNENIDVTRTVDARGSACPGPLMELIGAFRSADSGTVVALLSDDEGSLTDVAEWAETAGNEILGIEERDDHYRFYVEKA